MNSMRTLTLVFALVLFCASTAVAEARECADCHDTPDPQAFSSSVHAPKAGASLSTACLSCHNDVELREDGHNNPEPVKCARCHAEAELHISKSVHGSQGTNLCTRCHFPHEITRGEARRPDTKWVYAQKTCAKCHHQEWQRVERSVHYRSENANKATCVDCHGSHDIHPHDDPRSNVHRLRQAGVCAGCHASEEAGFSKDHISKVEEYFRSAHGLAIEKSGLVVAATCADCHSYHEVERVKDAGSPAYRLRVPETCGRCHQKAKEEYFNSVHGKPLLGGNPDVPVCTDCHTSHMVLSPLHKDSTVYPTHVSEMCLKCHDNARYIDRYNFPPLRRGTYLSSYHGAASRLGDTRVANCGSCHGSHEIRRSDDPLSMTNPANMKKTCGKCHKTGDPSTPLVAGKIHASTAREHHWLTSLVEKIYIGLIAIALLLMAIFIPTDARRRWLDARRKRSETAI